MSENNKDLIITLTGPSGAGKSFLAGLLKNEGYQEAVSTTTRDKRVGEIEGESYYFIDRNEFNKRVQNGDFVETIEMNNNFYGIEAKNLIKKQGVPVVIVAEPNGVSQIQNYAKKNNIKTYSIFINSPKVVLYERLLERFKDEILNIYKTNPSDLNKKDSINNADNLLIKDIANVFLKEENKGSLTIIDYFKKNILSLYNIAEQPNAVKDQQYKKAVLSTLGRIEHIDNVEFPVWVEESKVNKHKYDFKIEEFNSSNTNKIVEQVKQEVNNLLPKKKKKLKL